MCHVSAVSRGRSPGGCMNFETCREGARKAPRTLSAVNLVKPRFESPRIVDSSLAKKVYRGTAILPLSAGSIGTTALATSRLLQPHLVSTPKRTTTSAAVRVAFRIPLTTPSRMGHRLAQMQGSRRCDQELALTPYLSSKALKAQASILLRVKVSTQKSYPVLRRLALQH
jgi:hypothetical protein